MIKRGIPLLITVMLILASCGQSQFYQKFDHKQLENGLMWHTLKYENDDHKPMFINVLDIDLRNYKGEIDIAHYPQELKKTTVIADEFSADAAVNGSFFNMRKGGSDVFFQADGKLVAETNSRPTFLDFAHNAAFAIDTSGNIAILSRPGSGWTLSPAFEDILAAGPLLLLNGKACAQDSVSFNKTHHPRTAAGITNKDHLVLVTVDGRTSSASGMSIWALQDFMKELGCKDALNLDGGGSTSMYIRSMGGIVNCPSDNRKFDHEGQRSISNAIILK